jgi:hypothetical protein
MMPMNTDRESIFATVILSLAKHPSLVGGQLAGATSAARFSWRGQAHRPPVVGGFFAALRMTVDVVAVMGGWSVRNHFLQP